MRIFIHIYFSHLLKEPLNRSHFSADPIPANIQPSMGKKHTYQDSMLYFYCRICFLDSLHGSTGN